MFMHKCQPLKYLVHDVSNFGFWEVLVPLLHKLVKVPFHIFKHKEELVILPDDFAQFYDIRMVQFL